MIRCLINDILLTVCRGVRGIKLCDMLLLEMNHLHGDDSDPAHFPVEACSGYTLGGKQVFIFSKYIPNEVIHMEFSPDFAINSRNPHV